MSNKTYPVREFENVLSYEESVDAWHTEARKMIPVAVRVVLLVVAAIGIGLVLSAVIWSDDLRNSLADAVTEEGIELTAGFFALTIGMIMTGAPFVFLAWVFAQLPPKPTTEHHRKTLELMRLYQATKKSEGR